MKFDNMSASQSVKGQLFGLPIRPDKADMILMPAPWSVSCSETGAVLGPECILRNSCCVDVDGGRYGDVWGGGMAMLPIPHGWKLKSNQLSERAKTYLQAREVGSKVGNVPLVGGIDQYTVAFKDRIKNKGLLYMRQGKMVGLVGGEQTCALGLMEACAEHYKGFGVLHVDAHADLRACYQGFVYSHATVMYHALQIPEVEVLVQVGLRSYGEEEGVLMREAGDRIASFTDYALQKAMYEGTPWGALCERVVGCLPERVYVSFDVDGLDPKLCPSTARPVPGGLDLWQAVYLMERVVEAGKVIVGFDLSEVAFNGETEWDGVVASHLLYHLGSLMAVSQGKGTMG